MGAALVLVMVGLGALAAGILIGRYYIPDDRLLRRTARHSRAYMRALNHLLARDHATVIDELRKVVEENIEEVEPYFALAALFRTGGEHERAIRVHQALALREGGSRKLRVRALFELGLDFRAAGMPRRSARAMEDVLVEEPKHEGALRALCGLYEEQGRYLEAAQVWQRLAKMLGEPPTAREHHLWVAAAQTAIAAGDLDSGKRLLKDARKGHTETGHFHAAAAELAASRGNPKASRLRLTQAIAAEPELTRYFLPGLIAAERALLEQTPSAVETRDELDDSAVMPTISVAELAAGGEVETGEATAIVPVGETKPAAPVPRPTVNLEVDAKRRAAQTLAQLETDAKTGGVAIALARAELLASIDPPAALAIHDQLGKDHAELLPTRVRAARIALADGKPDRVAAELGALAGALAWAADGRWRCIHCGHRAPDFAWRCPACRRWSTSRVDLGGEPPEAPRERRERSRERTDLGRPALLGESATAALPSPSLDHGLSDDDLVRARTRKSLLGRVGGWISGAWSGIRGSNRRSAD